MKARVLLRAQRGTSGRRRLRARSPDSSAIGGGPGDQRRAPRRRAASCAPARSRRPAGWRRHRWPAARAHRLDQHRAAAAERIDTASPGALNAAMAPRAIDGCMRPA